MKTWICEITCIATKTILIDAESRADAKKKLLEFPREGEGIDVSYGQERARRILREDGKAKRKYNQKGD